MSESEPRVSGDLLRLIRTHGSAEKLLREHTPDREGRCRLCRSLGCTLYQAALAASAPPAEDSVP